MYILLLTLSGHLLLIPRWTFLQEWISLFCFLSPSGRCHQHSVWLRCQAKTSKWNITLLLSTKGVGRAFELAWWPCALLFPCEGSRSADCNLHERLCAPVRKVVAGQFNHRGWYFHRHCIVTGKTRLLSGCHQEMIPRESPCHKGSFA